MFGSALLFVRVCPKGRPNPPWARPDQAQKRERNESRCGGCTVEEWAHAGGFASQVARKVEDVVVSRRCWGLLGHPCFFLCPVGRKAEGLTGRERAGRQELAGRSRSWQAEIGVGRQK